ncbi:MAG: restriction endonuclease [Bacteroidetes bacterium HGW-Bacteroidetes-7]|jgi:DNA (cytosine-5)-methyltransferase 1|nr:MAG: restriction endonuclease [Bacteroidetes bacterium HGW-Bacteroidetes-7]
MRKLTFIDLFAGLGGFHLALEQLGCKCVFASEIKEDLRHLYNINFPDTQIYGDITRIYPEDIPPHDILCAGFPCQPFSQAGKRQGFNDEKERGNLFDNICAILEIHRPEYVLLENVSNLKGHDHGNTWRTIKSKLEALNYEVFEPKILSPHEFGIPQHRRRIYIVCRNKDFGTLDGFSFPTTRPMQCDINKIIDTNEVQIQKLKPESRNQLAIWQEFIDLTIQNGDTLPSFPIWSMEFGANYKFEATPPAFQNLEDLVGSRGKLGQKVTGTTVAECLSHLPNYAYKDKNKVFPQWKIRYIRQNREFYNRHKSWLDSWIEKVKNFDNSHLKMEWNCGKDAEPTIENKIIQFRASGIRVKMPSFSPALNLISTQIPIFPWLPLPKEALNEGEPDKGRYMTLKEASKLQGMQDLKFGDNNFTLSQGRSFEALGNAVNVTIIKHIVKKLLKL